MTALAEEIARLYGTPSVVIDLDRVERNIAKLQAAWSRAMLRSTRSRSITTAGVP